MRQLARAASQEAPKYFTRDETRKIISPELKGENYKAWFLCLFLWNTGVRITEGPEYPGRGLRYPKPGHPDKDPEEEERIYPVRPAL